MLGLVVYDTLAPGMDRTAVIVWHRPARRVLFVFAMARDALSRFILPNICREYRTRIIDAGADLVLIYLPLGSATLRRTSTLC